MVPTSAPGNSVVVLGHPAGRPAAEALVGCHIMVVQQLKGERRDTAAAMMKLAQQADSKLESSLYKA